LKRLATTLAAAIVCAVTIPAFAKTAGYSVAPVGPSDGHAVDMNGAGEVAGWGGPPIDNTDVSWIVAADGIHFTICELALGGINGSGVVTGKAYPPGETYPCVYDYRTDRWSRLSFSPWQNAGGGRGINDHGDVAGWWGTNPMRAVLWTKQDDGTYRGKDLGTLGGAFARANDTAAPGEAVGAAQRTSGYWRAFSYSGGRMRGLGTLGGLHSEAVRVSGGPGYIAGWAHTSAGVRHAFRYVDGEMRDLGTLGGARSEARSVNRFGTVVGWARIGSGAQHAFVWKNGTMYDLNELIPAGSGWVLTEATGNNGKGQIVGNGYYNGVFQAFRLRPHG
jgi:chitinase